MIGETVSHYRIVAELGAGGMGVVYAAEDTKLRRTVALKFLPPELTRDPEAKARFVHEARAASALDHPNVCTIHEIDETEDGRMFLAMACYDGGTLKQRITRGPLPLEVALDIARNVAQGLAKAHECGIVHRDVKPANIFLTNDGQVKLVDFGLAKLAGQTRMTRPGTTLGTVSYLAPEQARGEEADPRADIWSLGVTLYEMLTGLLPFRGENEQAVIHGILNDEPEPITAQRVGVPLELERIVAKALAKSYRLRYQHVDEMLVDMMTLQQSMVSGSRDLDVTVGLSQYRGAARRTFSPRALMLVAVAVVAVGIGIGWLIFRGSSDPGPFGERSLAVVNFLDLIDPDDPAGSAGLTGLLHVGLMESSPIRVVSPEHLYDLRRRLFGSRRGPIDDEQALEVAREARASDLLSGQMGGAGTDRYVTWRLVDAHTGEIRGAGRADGAVLTALADQVVAEVLRLLDTGGRAGPPQDIVSVATLTTTSPEAYKHYVAGKLAEEEVREDDAYRHLQQAVAIDSTFALAHVALSQSWYLLYEFETRREHLDTAWRHRDKLSTCDRLLLEAWRIRLREHRPGDFHAEAKRVYEEVLARWPDDRDALLEYGMFLYGNWAGDKALPVFEKALELGPHDLVLRHSHGLVLHALGRLPEALASTRRYLRLNPGIPNTWDEMGLRHLGLGQPDSAEHYFRKALEIDPEFIYSRRGLACAAYARGDNDAAIGIFESLLADTMLTPARRRTVIWRFGAGVGLSNVYFDLGRFRDYFDLQQREKARGTSFMPERSARWYMERFDLMVQAADSALAALGPNPANRRDPFWELQARGLALCKLDSLDEAQATYERLLAARTDSSPHLTAYCDYVKFHLELARGDAEAALATMAGVLRNETHFWGYLDVQIRSDEAEALRAAGRHEEAVATLRDLLRVYGGHVVAHYHLGRVYEEMGRPADAEREYEVFLEAWAGADEGLPKLVDARRRLAGLRARG